jgi:hypothetical protein
VCVCLHTRVGTLPFVPPAALVRGNTIALYNGVGGTMDSMYAPPGGTIGGAYMPQPYVSSAASAVCACMHACVCV